jgi:glycine oxidase
MAEAFTREGGILRTSAPVDEILIEGGIARGCLLQSGEELTADAVLAAAGAWTRKLGGVAKKHLPRIRPVRGQMLSLEMMEGAPLCDMVIRAPDAYIVPRSDGELVIGATMEEMGFDTRLTAGGVFELLRGAWETMPGVYDLSISELWTGFRPISLSNEPILGPSPDIENLWFATGHGRNGILLTPATALHMAEAMHTGVVPEALLRFLP